MNVDEDSDKYLDSNPTGYVSMCIKRRQVGYLVVLIPDLCLLSYFVRKVPKTHVLAKIVYGVHQGALMATYL